MGVGTAPYEETDCDARRATQGSKRDRIQGAEGKRAQVVGGVRTISDLRVLRGSRSTRKSEIRNTIFRCGILPRLLSPLLRHARRRGDNPLRPAWRRNHSSVYLRLCAADGL